MYDEGKASEVAARLPELVQGQGAGDEAQFNAARAFAIAELETLKPDALVKIDARGTRTDKTFTISFNLYLKA